MLTEAMVLGCSGQLHTRFLAVLWGILVVHALCLWVITTADCEMRVFALKPSKSPLEDRLRRSSLSDPPLSPFLFPSHSPLSHSSLPSLFPSPPLIHPPSTFLLPSACLPPSQPPFLSTWLLHSLPPSLPPSLSLSLLFMSPHSLRHSKIFSWQQLMMIGLWSFYFIKLQVCSRRLGMENRIAVCLILIILLSLLGNLINPTLDCYQKL